MRILWYIERKVIAVLLLLLLALAPAMAQNVVYQGQTTPLAVEQRGLDNYQWHLYSDSTVNFAVAPPDVLPPYAEFIGGSNSPEVSVLWKIPGTYFFKVTAVDNTGCAMNLKIGKMKVIDAIPVLTAEQISAKCYGEAGFIVFTVTNTPPGNYVIKHDRGEFPVTIDSDGKATISARPMNYTNLVIEVGNFTSYNPAKIVNVQVTQPTEIVITETVTTVDPYAFRKGAISLRVTGGSGNYVSYNWSNGATTRDISNLEIGEYNVTVTDGNGCQMQKTIRVHEANTPPIAVNDLFYTMCNAVNGNVILNDTDKEKDPLFINETPHLRPKHGTVVLLSDGNFEYRPDLFFTGTDYFSYELFDMNRIKGIYGTVVIHVLLDTDRDGIEDPPLDNLALKDKDADGDGLVNELDGTDDADGDGLPNYLDIDSDGDGILDHHEVQATGKYKKPSYLDEDKNGLDDAYDNFQMTPELVTVDSDADGTPDYLDLDSDDDNVPDYIEGHDLNEDGKPDQVARGRDNDGDGLDDGYDTYQMQCNPEENILASNALRQDSEGDGIPDYRDINDDDDEFLTKFEDLDGDGIYSNDDMDYDGRPEYLDYGRDCDLFIPNAFSPNDDGVHDYFQIYCINHFPNAKLFIFDQLGNKIYEKANYGNVERWGSYSAAWWNGMPDRGKGKGELVPMGTYYYVLDLGNGEVKKSFIFVSY